MTLRVISGSSQAFGFEAASSTPKDDFPSRLAKLIPGEALTLYGAGSAIIPDDAPIGLWFLAVVCLAVTGALRWMATKDATGKPQIFAIVIALISFALWVVALDQPAGPIDWSPDNTWIPSLIALLWTTIVPIFYKGDAA